MAVYKWFRKPTKHFGEVWFPLAQIGLRDKLGHFQAIAIQIDSGATVSLLRRSSADLLSIDFDKGRRVDMSGVGGSQIAGFVHPIAVRFDNDWPPIEVPFVIAEIENVPNLLGRLGVFEQFRIDFDPRLTETRFSATWLND